MPKSKAVCSKCAGNCAGFRSLESHALTAFVGQPGVAALLDIACPSIPVAGTSNTYQSEGGGGGKEAGFVYRERQLATAPSIFWSQGGIISGASGEPSPFENAVTY